MKAVPSFLVILLLWANDSVAFPSKQIPGQHPSHLTYRKTSLIQHDSFLISDDEPTRGRILPLAKIESKTIIGQLTSKLPSNESIWKKAKSIHRRLDTAEDKFDLHKLSCLVYLAAAIHILLVGGVNAFTSIPTSVKTSTYCFFAASIVQGMTSIEMALKYRKNDPIVRAGFVNMACNMISLGWAVVIGSPFSPRGISEKDAHELMLISLLPVLFFTSAEILTMRNRIQNRKRRKNEKGGDLGSAGDVFSYMFTTVAGCIAALGGIVILSDPSHDSLWLEDTFGTGDGLVGVQSYYSGVITSLSVAMGAFSITLRDRKIIGKQSEQLLIGLPTTIFVLAQLKALNIV